MGLLGFSKKDNNGQWKGLDVDICRAVAAAVLGDANKVTYIPLENKNRFTALQNGKIDLLAKNTTLTYRRDTSLKLNFVGVNYYDGQGFLINKKFGITSAKELNGVYICVKKDSSSIASLFEYFELNGMSYNPIEFNTSENVLKGLENGKCDVITSDVSQLYSLKNQMKNSNNYEVLPDIITKEPLGPVVRNNDDKWYKIVKWTLNVLIAAEEFNINSKNIEKLSKEIDMSPKISRLIGTSGDLGSILNLDTKWAYNIIKQVGNYDEIFQRNIGSKSKLKIKRGLNNLWTNGGLMYSPPFK